MVPPAQMRYRLASMSHAPPRLRSALCALGLFGLAALAPLCARAAAQGEALVIGEASYSNFPPLQGCALSAHSVASALRRLGFTVEEQDNASSGAVFAAIATLARRLGAARTAPVFVYVCSYATAFDNRPFMLPDSAQVSRPADVLTQGVLMQSLVDAVHRNTQAPAVIALDAIPAPKAPASLELDRLATGLPPNVGLLAVQEIGAGDVPTALAAQLGPALHGPAMSSAKLLTDLRQQLASQGNVKIAAVHVPTDGLYLAQAHAPAPVPPPSTIVPAAAMPAPAASAAAGVTSLPAEDQMTDAQRRIAQRALARLGYYDGRIDGIFGPDTRAAIRRWQHELKAPMTGRLTAVQATQLVNR